MGLGKTIMTIALLAHLAIEQPGTVLGEHNPLTKGTAQLHVGFLLEFLNKKGPLRSNLFAKKNVNIQRTQATNVKQKRGPECNAGIRCTKICTLWAFPSNNLAELTGVWKLSLFAAFRCSGRRFGDRIWSWCPALCCWTGSKSSKSGRQAHGFFGAWTAQGGPKPLEEVDWGLHFRTQSRSSSFAVCLVVVALSQNQKKTPKMKQRYSRVFAYFWLSCAYFQFKSTYLFGVCVGRRGLANGKSKL